MSSVETGQVSAVETGQMSAAETGQMSAVETRQMSCMKTGQRPVAIENICLVSTAAICPVSAADICPVSTADICPVSTEDIYPVSAVVLPAEDNHFQTLKTDFASHRRREFRQATPRAEFKTDAAISRKEAWDNLATAARTNNWTGALIWQALCTQYGGLRTPKNQDLRYYNAESI